MHLRILILALLSLPYGLFAQVNPCMTRDTSLVVILGSSTAAGTGPSVPDSTWVNRFRTWMQSLNPANQVINRAQGGYVTYRSMPTGYVPPANRPAPDTTKNITYALSLNPDAIIVNYPSNDVSSGYSVAEQLANFDTIVSHAQAANVPIWICTTQPKDFPIGSVNIQKQMDVRDSILARYGSFAIDFWTGFADANNQLAAWCDEDGTHMNDAGHRVLFQRVQDLNIPLFLYQSPPFVDYSPMTMEPIYFPICGDSQSVLRTGYFNSGLNDSGNTLDIQLEVYLNGQLQSTLSSNNQNGLSGCLSDSLDWTVNTWQPGNYLFRVITQSTNDGAPGNDTLEWGFSSLGHPTAQALGDTACSQSSLSLWMLNTQGDSVFWYDGPTSPNSIAQGPLLITPPLSSSDTFYAEVIRGNLFYQNDLSTTYNSNINWNGAMFDLVADSALVLDSFALKMADPGAQIVEIYTRSGSHVGFQGNAGAWTYYGAVPVSVAQAEDIVTLPLSNLSLSPGDTLGVYLQLQNPNSRLTYRSLNSPQTRSTQELQIITGSGVSHNFSGSYYPRDWNGSVYYHYGYRPGGDCSTGRIAVPAIVSQPEIDLGADTLLNVTASITLDAGPGFSNYVWSTGATGQTLTLQGSQWGTGIYTLTVNATDLNGCIASDTIIVVFAPLLNRNTPLEANLELAPNPSAGPSTLSWQISDRSAELRVVDLHGKTMLQRRLSGAYGSLSLDLPAGCYSCHLHCENGEIHKKLLILPFKP